MSRFELFFLRFSKYKFWVYIFPFLLIYTAALIQTAWVSDDAFITFRSIENFVNGYGPVYNVGERVQTFTHPLWFLVQSSLNITLNWMEIPFGFIRVYFTNYLASILISLITVLLFSIKVARSTANAALGLLTLTLSKAFLDFSTSGLENPLSHIIFISFIWVYLSDEETRQRRVAPLFFLAGLGILNRLDTLLIYFPALCYLLWTSDQRGKSLLFTAAGFLPLILWLLFSLFYYGFAFPNTAYAKLDTGIDHASLIKQGIFYFLNSIKLDPISLTVVIAAATLIVITRKKHHLPVAMGVLVYLLYILFIGGDFMSGRYFSLPVLASVALISNYQPKPSIYISGLAAILLIGLLPLMIVPERSRAYAQSGERSVIFIDQYKIADERLIYVERTGLLAGLQGKSPKVVYEDRDWAFLPGQPVTVEIFGAVGINGYRSGPNIHVIDRNGLIDPLMARMPLENTEHWRIGHFHHMLPEGYLETLTSGTNMIRDKSLAEYYEKFSFIYRGELWNWSRIVEIWKINTGAYNYLIEAARPAP